MSMHAWKVVLLLAATLCVGNADSAWAQRGRGGGGRFGSGRMGAGSRFGTARAGNWSSGGFSSGGGARHLTPGSGSLGGGHSAAIGQGNANFLQRHNSGLSPHSASGAATAGSGSARQSFATRHGSQANAVGGTGANTRTATSPSASSASRTVINAGPAGAVASGSNGTFVRVGGFAIGVGSNGGFYLRLGRPFYGYGYGLWPFRYGYYPYPYYAYPYYSYYPGAVVPADYVGSPASGYPTQSDGVAMLDNALAQPPVVSDVPKLIETAVADAGPSDLPHGSSDLDLNGDFARQGEAAFKAGNYSKAVRAWRHAVLDDPQNGTLVMMLAQALFAAGNYDEAAGATQQGLLLLPEEQWNIVVVHHKELYGRIGDYTTQLRSLEQARKAKFDDPALRFLLGYHYGFLGYPERALKELDKGLELVPKDELAQKLRTHFAVQLK